MIIVVNVRSMSDTNHGRKVIDNVVLLAVRIHVEQLRCALML